MAKFTLAVDRPKRPDGTAGGTDFIDVVSWGRQAENVGKFCTKGKMVLVEGRIQVRTYNDNAGTKKWATEVVSNSVVFLGGGAAKERSDRTQDIAEAFGGTADMSNVQDPQFSQEPVAVEEDIPF